MGFSPFRGKDILACIIAIYQLCLPLVAAIVIAGVLGALLFHFLFR